MIGIAIVDDIVEAINDFFRSFMITLDKIVYWFVEQVLQLIVDLANVNIFSDTTINAFARRIYVILGLVMVFKLMISFIQILIDPDTMSDKEKGVGNVLKRVVISMALIVLVPSIFKMARDVQGYILPIIPKVVLGIDSGNEVTEPITEHNIGNVMAWYSFLPFFDYANDECAATGTIQKAVGGDMAVYEIYSVSTAADHINDKNSCNGGDYMYSHRYLISTLVGAYLLFTLVQVALNVAIRAIKFGICEFVAPIPIASYIDPKTSKSTFDKWVNTSIKVYLDLFIQLISIYFVVFVFMVVFKEDNIGAILENVGNDMWRATLVMLFIIVGLIKFVKEFPKFLSGLLGLKTDGAIGKMLSPSNLLTGVASTAGFAKNLVKAPISNVSQLNKTTYANGSNPNTWRKIGSAIGGVGGVVGNTIRGVASGKTGKDLTKYTFDRLTSNRDARIDRKNRRASGYSWGQEKKEEYLQRMHISGKDSWTVEEYSEYDKMASLMGDAGALGLKKGEEQKHKITTTFNGQPLSYTDLETIANSHNGDTFDDRLRKIHWKIDSGMISRARGAILDLQKQNKTQNYANLLKNGDAGAVQIYNKILDHVKNSPAFTQPKTIDTFADKLFKTTRDSNGKITSSTPLTIVKSNGTTVTYNASNFDYAKLKEIVSDRDIFANNDVQLAFKDASETMRNIAQTEQYAAERREKARNEARKAHEKK